MSAIFLYVHAHEPNVHVVIPRPKREKSQNMRSICVPNPYTTQPIISGDQDASLLLLMLPSAQCPQGHHVITFIYRCDSLCDIYYINR